MRFMLHFGVLVVLVLSTATCRSTSVRTDWDTNVSFGELHRFAWREPEPSDDVDPFADNSLLRSRLRGAIQSALLERGFVNATPPESADFAVTYRVILDDRIRGDGGNFVGIGAHLYGHRNFHSDFRIRDYQESTLIIDVLDGRSNQLIWRGWGAGVVGTRDQERSDAHVKDGIREILDAFPPKPSAER